MAFVPLKGCAPGVTRVPSDLADSQGRMPSCFYGNCLGLVSCCCGQGWSWLLKLNSRSYF